MEKPGEISSSSLKHKRKATLKKNNYYNFFKKSNPKQISYAFHTYPLEGFYIVHGHIDALSFLFRSPEYWWFLSFLLQKAFDIFHVTCSFSKLFFVFLIIVIRHFI